MSQRRPIWLQWVRQQGPHGVGFPDCPLSFGFYTGRDENFALNEGLELACFRRSLQLLCGAYKGGQVQ